MKPSEVIREARSLLFERGWATKTYQDETGALCMRGALGRADKRDRDLVKFEGCVAADVGPFIAVAVDDFLGALPGLMFNDEPGRTFDEVVDAFDRAEKLALIAEESDE